MTPISRITFSMLCFLAIMVTARRIQAQTGNPHYDVTDPAYGAMCNGTHDDTSAFQAALNAANGNGGGVVFVPATVAGPCVIAGYLSLDDFRFVTLLAESNGNSAGQTFDVTPTGTVKPVARPIVRFTGAPPVLISMKSTMGVRLQGLFIDETNSTFNGMIVDLEHSSTGDDSIGDMFQNVAFNTDSTVAACGICGDNADTISIDQCSFSNLVTAIQGTSRSGSGAVNWTISRTYFHHISGPYIASTGANWNIGPGNTFEMNDDNASNTSGAIVDNTNASQYSSVNFFANWVGDTNLPNGGTFFKNIGNLFNLRDSSISGNFTSNNVNLVSVASSAAAITITGNALAQFNTLVTLPSANSTQLTMTGNAFNIGGGALNALWSNPPAVGMVVDSTNHTNFYGTTGFNGATGTENLWVNGTLYKSAGSFRIDHPLDPANKYLSHSFVESPDMMNVYNGVVLVNAKGRAKVTLPAYFEALNQDFRYQITPIGSYAPVYIAQKIRGNFFVIAGGKPGMEISWQVTGIRHDPYAKAHPIVVEESKPMGKQDPH